MADRISELEAEVERLREGFREYAEHQSWRCEHREANFYLVGRDAKKNPDCPCGLDAELRDLGLSGPSDENREGGPDGR